MENDKYVVMKAEEFEQWQTKSNFWWGHVTRPRLPGDVDEPPGLPEVLDDAIVIRKQDVFASSALFAYAHNIQTALEILEGGSIGKDSMDHLEELRDFFFEQATEAQELKGVKVPD